MMVKVMESGNYVIDVRAGRKFTLHFPMGHYHGISLRLHMKEANQELAEFVKGVNIDVYAIRDKFVSEGQPFITKPARWSIGRSCKRKIPVLFLWRCDAGK